MSRLARPFSGLLLLCVFLFPFRGWLRASQPIQERVTHGHALHPRGPCGLRERPDSPESRLWQQARAILEAVERTERAGAFVYDLVVHERRLEARHLSVVAEPAHWRVTAHRGDPLALPEAERLDTLSLDPATLLQPTFLDAHCFALVPVGPDDKGFAALAFKPRPAAAGIEAAGMEAAGAMAAGTLWIDTARAGLSSIELHAPATAAASRSAMDRRVWYARLPDGHWTVRRWRTRAPAPRAPHQIREVGAEVTAVRDSAGRSLMTAALPALEGVVYDSTRNAPLAGARVTLAGTQRAAITNAAGRFVMTDLPPGHYRVHVTHPRLDSLGVARLDANATLARGDVVYGDFALPTLASIRDRTCSAHDLAAHAAMILGYVSAAQGDAGEARVLAGWTDGTHEMRLLKPVTATGHYLLCGVPSDRPVQVWAVGPAQLSDTLRFWLRPGEVKPVSLRLHAGPAGAIRGRVVDDATGHPISGVHIEIADVGRDTTTGLDGTFQFNALPVGRYVLDATVHGYARAAGWVIVRAGDTTRARLALKPSQTAGHTPR